MLPIGAVPHIISLRSRDCRYLRGRPHFISWHPHEEEAIENPLAEWSRPCTLVSPTSLLPYGPTVPPRRRAECGSTAQAPASAPALALAPTSTSACCDVMSILLSLKCGSVHDSATERDVDFL